MKEVLFVGSAIIFFGYLVPGFALVMFYGNKSIESFNKLFIFDSFALTMYDKGFLGNSRINWIPCLNAFVFFRLVFYSITKK